jgi:hypothetical protein
MPHMVLSYIHVYSFCDDSATAAVEECHQFAMRRIPDRIIECFLRRSIHCVNVVLIPTLVFQLNEHVKCVWSNRKPANINLLLSREDSLDVSVFHRYMYDGHCVMTACTISPTVCAKSVLVFCWYQLLVEYYFIVIPDHFICSILENNPQFSIRTKQLTQLHPCWCDITKMVIQDGIKPEMCGKMLLKKQASLVS